MWRLVEVLAVLLLLAVAMAVAVAEDGGVVVGVDEYKRYIREQVYHVGKLQQHMVIDTQGLASCLQEYAEPRGRFKEYRANFAAIGHGITQYYLKHGKCQDIR